MPLLSPEKAIEAIDLFNRKVYNKVWSKTDAIREVMRMLFLLFGFWVLLMGAWTTEIALTGLVVAGLVYAFCCAFMGYSPKKEWQIVRRLGRIIGYLGYLVGEIFKSAFAVIKLIWSPKLVTEPKLSSFHTRLHTQAGKVVLANSITMTPGTITVDVRGDKFLIHCLDAEFDVGQEGFEMEQRVMKVEGGKHDA